MAARRILIVTYYFPPLESTGSNRWGTMVRHLRALGNDVTVVTAAPDSGDRDVVSTADLRAVEPLRRALGRPSLAGLREGEPIDLPAPDIFTRVLVPDMFVASWVPFARAAVRRVLRSRTIDCVVTTSPPESTHLIGLGLRGRRPAWLVDLRDGWSFEPYRDPFPTALQRRLDARLERAVMSGADGHVAVTAPMADDLRVRFGVAAGHVPNGFDAEPGVSAAAMPPSSSGAPARLVHTGRLSRVRGRDPRPLFQALALLRRREPNIARALRLVLVGPLDTYEERLIHALALTDCVEAVGSIPRPAALHLQRTADALLLVTSSSGSEATGKVYEYLGAGRPIVALTGRSEAARIVEETRSGIVVPPGDAEAIAGALMRVARRETVAAPSAAAIARYRYPAPAEALHEQVEMAIARRRNG